MIVAQGLDAAGAVTTLKVFFDGSGNIINVQVIDAGTGATPARVSMSVGAAKVTWTAARGVATTTTGSTIAAGLGRAATVAAEFGLSPGHA